MDNKLSTGQKTSFILMLIVLSIILMFRYVIPKHTQSANSEVKIPKAELDRLQVKAKIATVLYKAERMDIKEACKLLSDISKREVTPYFHSYPKKKDFSDVVEQYLKPFIEQSTGNIRIPIEFWIDTYRDAAIKNTQPLVEVTNIFVAIWTTTSYPDVSKLKLLKTEGNKETWYFPLDFTVQAYFIKKTKGASWLSGEHYIADSPQFIKGR
jgi:hypothetical protein